MNKYISQAVQLHFKPYKHEKWRTVRLKETVCHGCLVIFSLQPITRPCMIRHGTWEREWQNHSIESNKICLPSLSDIKRYKQLKLDFDKMLGWQNFLLQVCPFVPVLYLLWYENILQWCKSNKPFHVFFCNFSHGQVHGKIRRLHRKEYLKISTITEFESC